MGKKRKKSSEQQTPLAAAVASATVATATPEPPVSVPAISEEKAAELVAASEEPKPEPKPEPVAEAKVEEAKIEEAEVIETKPIETKVEEKVEAAPASEVAPASAAPATTRPKKKRAKKRTTKPPVSREALDQKIDRLEAKLEEKKDAAAKAAREGFGSKPDDDDQSVPPVDLEVHDAFFAAGEKEHAIAKESGSYAALDPRHAQKMSAVAHARRAHLSKYVKWSVGAAAGILMLGFAIKTFRGHPNEEPVRHEVTHATQVAEPIQQQPVQQPQNVAPPPVVEVDDKQADEAKTDDKKTDNATDTKAAPEETDKKEDLPPEKPKNAWQEKQAAKAALERGANATAIQAGERSVALDPSDGEAWLVLGGAYQAMGNNAQAKRCYNACVTQGKKGPISDCKDVLGSM